MAKLGAATPQLACEIVASLALPGNPADTSDTASKGAVLAMTRELAMVHAREGIRFNALCPYVTIIIPDEFQLAEMTSGPIRTPLLMDFLNEPAKLNRRMVHNPMGRFGEAVEQAKAVVFRQ